MGISIPELGISVGDDTIGQVAGAGALLAGGYYAAPWLFGGGAAASGASSAAPWITGGLGLAGSLYTNAQAGRQSQAMMDFQRDMSGTAHQREVNDLRAAGLNPMLSVNAGASTPTGAQAPQQDPIASALSSALQLKNMQLAAATQEKQVDNIQADTDKKNMETKVIAGGVPESEAKAGVWSWIKDAWKNRGENSKVPESQRKHLKDMKSPVTFEQKTFNGKGY